MALIERCNLMKAHSQGSAECRLTTQNFFSELSNAMPPENFLTNCFAFLLRENFALPKALFAEFFPSIFQHTYVESITTQYGMVKIADIRIHLEGRRDYELVIENKLGTQPYERQIAFYLSKPHRYVLLIAQSRDISFTSKTSHDPRFHALSWAEVYERLVSCARKPQFRNMVPSLNQFLEFLRSLGVRMIDGFEKSEVGSAWERYQRFRMAAEAFLEGISKKMRGYEPRWYDSLKNGEFGYQLTSKKNRRCPYWVGFELKHGKAMLSVGVFFYPQFRQHLRDKFLEETDKVEDAL